MLFGWIQNWRERRGAMRDLALARRQEEAALADRIDNPFVRAKAAIDRGELEFAAELWEEARRRMPEFVIGAKDSFKILLALERFDEAEALIAERRLSERRRRSRDDNFCLSVLAHIAVRRGDMPEAAKRWAAVRALGYRDLEAHFHGNVCLRSLGRLDEAAALMDDAIAREPGSLDAWMERASIDEACGKPEASLEFLKAAMLRFGFKAPLAGYVRVLTQLDRTAEAADFLEDLARRNPGEADIVAARARLARSVGDMTTASKWWAEVRRCAPSFTAAYQEDVECLLAVGDVAGAEVLLRGAVEHFHDKSWPGIRFARLAHDRGDWPEAAVRWEAVLQRFPNETEVHSLLAAALKGANITPPGSQPNAE
jgi:tetratricopeptide (TPR) repeat protein